MKLKPSSDRIAAPIGDPTLGRAQSSELRQPTLDRDAFLKRPREPITVVLDRVKGAHNIGTIFRDRGIIGHAKNVAKSHY